MCEPLELFELRKTQRRVAALLQKKNINIFIHKPSRKKNWHLYQHVKVCSKLDPDGKYRDPALDYMRQGLQEAREYYENLGLNDTDSGTEAPFNSPEHSKLSLKQYHGDEDVLFQKSKSLKRLKQRERNKWGSDRPASSEDTLYREGHDGNRSENKSKDHHRRLTKSFEKLTDLNEDDDAGDKHVATSFPQINKSGLIASQRSKKEKTNKSLHGALSLPSLTSTPDEPHLRYQHGIARKSVPNDAIPLSHENTQDFLGRLKDNGKTNSADMCSCKHPVPKSGVSSGMCPECQMRNGHKVNCSMKAHQCQVCGKSVSTKAKLLSDGVGKDSAHRRSHMGLHGSNLGLPEDDERRLGRNDSRAKDRFGKSGRRSQGQHGFGGTELGPDGDHMDFRNRKQGQRKGGLSDGVGPNGAQSHALRPNGYRRKLQELQVRFDKGDFDYEAGVNINDVDTTLKTFRTGDSYEIDENGDVMKGGNVRSSSSSSQNEKYWIDDESLTLYPNGAREAYIKALAIAQFKKLNADPWLLGNQISRSYVFSYFQNIPSAQARCSDCGVAHPPGPVCHTEARVRRGKEMQHIFGNVNVDDYYPGMKKNPVTSLTVKKTNRRGRNKKKKKKQLTLVEDVPAGDNDSGVVESQEPLVEPDLNVQKKPGLKLSQGLPFQTAKTSDYSSG